MENQRLPHPVSLFTLRRAITAGRMISIYHKGERLKVEPHAIVNAQRTGALVLVAWSPALDDWAFYRFAEIRGLEFLERSFTPRPNVPHQCRVARPAARSV